MPTVWNRVEALNGKTLHTRARNKEFEIINVLPDRIQFVPKQGNGTTRWVTRDGIEQIAELNLDESELKPSRLQREFPDDQNLSYIAAIVYAVQKQ